MSSLAAAVAPHARARKRRWGYLVWVVAGIVVVVPELTAAAAGNVLPFTTISTMTGHLERHHPWVELIVVAVIVFVVFSTLKVPPRRERAGSRRQAGEPARTPGGRLTAQAPPEASPATFDEEDAPAWFALAAILSLVAIAAATWAASWWWDTGHHYETAYVLYGLLGLLWVVVPSVLAFVLGKDLPFPTLFRSVGNLEDWLRNRSWPLALGAVSAWLVGYLLLAGLVILLLHLTLYPYPNITHILNPGG